LSALYTLVSLGTWRLSSQDARHNLPLTT
jgi:hypothetical protein